MPSRISQMRNGQMPQQTSQPLNEQYMAQLRGIMNAARNSGNSRAFLQNLFGDNPQIAQLISNPNLEGIARSMAAQKGADINNVLRGLGG